MTTVFIQEVTCRAYLIAEASKRRTLSRTDIARAIAKSDQFDFLLDIIPREPDANFNASTGVRDSHSDNSSSKGKEKEAGGEASSSGQVSKAIVSGVSSIPNPIFSPSGPRGRAATVGGVATTMMTQAPHRHQITIPGQSPGTTGIPATGLVYHSPQIQTSHSQSQMSLPPCVPPQTTPPSGPTSPYLTRLQATHPNNTTAAAVAIMAASANTNLNIPGSRVGPGASGNIAMINTNTSTVNTGGPSSGSGSGSESAGSVGSGQQRSTPSPIRPSSPQVPVQSYRMAIRSPVSLSSHFGPAIHTGPTSPTTTTNHSPNSVGSIQLQPQPSHTHVQVTTTNSPEQGPNLRAGLSRRMTHPPLPPLSQSPAMLAPGHMSNVSIAHGHGLSQTYGSPERPHSLPHHAPHPHAYGPSSTTNSPQTPLSTISQLSQPISAQPHSYSHSQGSSVHHPSHMQLQAQQRARGQSIGSLESSSIPAVATSMSASDIGGAAAEAGPGTGVVTGSGIRPPPRIAAEPDESNVFYQQVRHRLIFDVAIFSFLLCVRNV